MKPQSRHSLLLSTILASTLMIALAVPVQASPIRSGGQSGQLTVQALAGGIFTEVSYAAKMFERSNPGVKITVESLTANNSLGPNIAVLSSSSPPDIGFVQVGSGDYTVLIQDHALANLDSVWQADDLVKQDGAYTAADFAVSGHYYGLDDAIALFPVIFWNLSQLHKVGLSLPASHEFSSLGSFQSFVATLLKSGDQGIALSGALAPFLGYVTDGLLPTAMTPTQYHAILTDWQPHSPIAVAYDSQPFESVLQTYVNWVKDHILAPGFLSLSYSQAEAEFVAGQDAGFISLDAAPAELKSLHVPFPVGWTTLPPMHPNEKVPLASFVGDSFVVPSHGHNQPLAEAFLKFFASARVQAVAPEAGGLLPVSTQVPASALKPLGPLVSQMVEVSARDGRVQPWDTTIPSTIGAAWEDPELAKLILGQITPAKLGSLFQQRLLNLRKQPVAGRGA